MARGPAPAWNQTAEHTNQMLPFVSKLLEAGYELEAELTADSRDQALLWKRGLFNAAKRLKVSVHVNLEPAGHKWRVLFTLHEKRNARAYMVEKYGTDRSAYPYDPRRKGVS